MMQKELGRYLLPVLIKIQNCPPLKKINTYCNGGQLKNPDISGTYALRIQHPYTQTQCEDGARDVRVLQLTPVIF